MDRARTTIEGFGWIIKRRITGWIEARTVPWWQMSLFPGAATVSVCKKTDDTVEIEAWVSPRRALLQFGSHRQHVERLVAALGY